MAKKLYVGNLNYDTSEETLKEHFSQSGTVEEAVIIKYPDTGRPKGFGFVTMSSDEEAAKAVEMLDGKELDGRPLKVNEARPREDRGNRFGSQNFSRPAPSSAPAPANNDIEQAV